MGAPDLIVTRGGVPVADQRQGVADFKLAALRAGNRPLRWRWLTKTERALPRDVRDKRMVGWWNDMTAKPRVGWGGFEGFVIEVQMFNNDRVFVTRIKEQSA